MSTTSPPTDAPTPSGLPATWARLVDDAALFPPGDSPLPEAARAFAARRGQWYADLVGAFVVPERALPDASSPVDDVPAPSPLSVVLGGGAGAIPGVCRQARRAGVSLAGLEIALRDPDDLPGNARRVVAALDAARSEGDLDDETPVHVELPPGEPTAGWLAAADEVAAAELRLKFRTGGLDAHLFPGAAVLAGWIDAALDRETPFKCTAGLHRAVRHTGDDGFEHHGFVNVLLATRRAFDGASADEVVATLEERDAATLVDAVGVDLTGARRWFTSFGSCSVDEPLDDLTALGLLEKP